MKNQQEIIAQNSKVYWETKIEVRDKHADRDAPRYLRFPMELIHDYEVKFALTKTPGLEKLIKYLHVYPLKTKKKIVFLLFSRLKKKKYNQNRKKLFFKDKVLQRVENLIKNLESKDEDIVQ